MVQASQITVLDANGNPVDVATLTAVLAATLGVNQVSVAHDFTVAMTRPNDTTGYTAGDVIGDATNGGRMQFTNMAKTGGGPVLVTGVQLEIDVDTPPASAFRLWLFSANPTAISDNAAFDVVSGDRVNLLGYVDIPAPVDGGSIAMSEANGIAKQIKLTGTSAYGILQAVSAYTPVAQAVYKVTLHTVDV